MSLVEILALASFGILMLHVVVSLVRGIHRFRAWQARATFVLLVLSLVLLSIASM